MPKRSRTGKKRTREPTKPPPPPVADDNPDLPFEVVFASPVEKNAPNAREVDSERPAQGDE